MDDWVTDSFGLESHPCSPIHKDFVCFGIQPSSKGESSARIIGPYRTLKDGHIVVYLASSGTETRDYVLLKLYDGDDESQAVKLRDSMIDFMRTFASLVLEKKVVCTC